MEKEQSSSSFTPFGEIYPDAREVETGGSTCRAYIVRRYGKLHFIKRLKPALSADGRYVEALRKEFHVGYNLDHPNIVRYEALGNDYVVLDYVEGRTLRQAIDKEDDFLKHEENIRKIVFQILSALSCLHSKGIVHLDLKPENIMLTTVGNDVKVLDLGFCYTGAYNDTTGRTDRYAAPEQTDGTRAVDGRTDLYALGCIISQLPCRSRLFKAAARRCTRREKERRFASAEEMAHYLDTHRQRHRRLIATAVAVPLMACVVSLAYLAGTRAGDGGEGKIRTDTLFAGLQPNEAAELRPAAARKSVPAEAVNTGRGEDLRRELSAAVAPLFQQTLSAYRDSTIECITDSTFMAQKTRFKHLSHDLAVRLARKYPAVRSDEVEQIWYAEVSSRLGSVGTSMMRNTPSATPAKKKTATP